MASPSTTLATQRPDLAASLEEFSLAMDSMGFIGHLIYRVITVAKQAGNFGRIPLEQLLAMADTERAPGSGYKRGEFTFTPASYATKEQGWEEPIDDREAQMYADYFDAEVIATARAMRRVMENGERRVAGKVFNTTTYTPTAVANGWNTTNGTPIDDVEAKIQNVYDDSGLWPNTMVITKKVFRNLRNSPQIVDRVKYQGFQDARAGNISVEAIAQALAIDNLLVAGGTQNTAKQSQPKNLSPIWSTEYAWIGRTAETDDFQEPCVGRTFHWPGDGSEVDGHVETYRDESIRGDVVRVRHDVDEVDLHAEAGGLLSGITA